MRTYHIPIFVPHKGCPNDCVFCNQRKITGRLDDVTPEDVVKTIEENLATMDKNACIEVAFFGGSFTGIDFDKQTALLKAAYPYVVSGAVKGIRCSTRADYIDKKILDNLKKYGVTTIELGVQSTDDEVLCASRRGHSFECVKTASELIKSYGISLGLQMMLGLPGDTEHKMLKTAQDLIDLSPECVRIYPTLVVPDTELCAMYHRGEYEPLSLEFTVDVLSRIIPMFLSAGINIIRIGLQTTDNINEATVQGPYHPAIRELATGRIIRNCIEENISSFDGVVYVSPRNVSAAVGHKGCNREYFMDKYSINLCVRADSELCEYEIRINDIIHKLIRADLVLNYKI